MDLLKKMARIYVYGNVHIALIAGLSFYFYNHEFNHASLIFLATWSYYNFCNIIHVTDYQKALQNERLTWVSKNLTEVIFITIGSIALMSFLWLKNMEHSVAHLDYIALASIILFGLDYFFIRHIPYLKNLVIALVWVLVMHLWSHWDTRPLDVFLLIYLLFISIYYDRTSSQLKKALIDCLIILPFYIYFLAEKF
jgi:hypothetical protein